MTLYEEWIDHTNGLVHHQDRELNWTRTDNSVQEVRSMIEIINDHPSPEFCGFCNNPVVHRGMLGDAKSTKRSHP